MQRLSTKCCDKILFIFKSIKKLITLKIITNHTNLQTFKDYLISYEIPGEFV